MYKKGILWNFFLSEAPSAPGFPHLTINCQKEIFPPTIFAFLNVYLTICESFILFRENAE